MSFGFASVGALVLFIYFVVGFVVGHASWRTWLAGKRTLLSLLLFPGATYLNEVGVRPNAHIEGYYFISNFYPGSPETYVAIMMFVWPLKILWSSVILTLGSVTWLVVSIFMRCVKNLLATVSKT